MAQYTDIGIDLGTASILVYIRGKGVVLKEPSVVAFDRDTNKIKAIGENARLMLGRTPGNIVAVRPLRQGVISDYTVTEKMLKHFIQKAVGKKSFRKPRIAVCVPSGVTEVEKRADVRAIRKKSEEKSLKLLKKIYYTNHIFEYNYFKNEDNYNVYVNNLNAINVCKEDIKTALVNKGVDMTGVVFSGYAEKINSKERKRT